MGREIAPAAQGASKVFFALLFLGFGVYFRTIFFPFVHDDIVFIQNNPSLKSWQDSFAVFLHASTPTHSLSIVNGYYRPLLEILNKVLYHFFALDPRGYHAFNIVLHVVNSFLVYSLFSCPFVSRGLLKGRQELAFWIGVLFLVHPAQTEAVACVSGVSNLVFSFFCLVSLRLYFVSKEQESLYKKKILLAAALASFVLALFSKEQSVALVFLIALSEFVITRLNNAQYACEDNEDAGSVKLSLGAVFLRIRGFVWVVVGYLFWRTIVVGSLANAVFAQTQEFVLRVLQIPQTLFNFLGILIVPVGLHYYRSIDILQPSLRPVVALVIGIGCFVYAVSRMPKEHRAVFVFAAGWFLIALLPTLNIVPLVNEYSMILTAEHFLYFPMIGFVLGMVFLAVYFSENILNRTSFAGIRLFFVLIAIVWGGLSFRQTAYWKTEVALFERVVRFEKNFGRGHLLLAKAYYVQKEFASAVVEFKKAKEIFEGYLSKVQQEQPRKFYLGFLKGIHFDLAHCLEDQGDLASAINAYQQALAIDPYDSVLHSNLGIVYLKKNDFAEAIGHFERAVQLNPKDVMAANNWAICLIQSGELSRAQKILSEVVAAAPRFLEARQNLERLRSSLSR